MVFEEEKRVSCSCMKKGLWFDNRRISWFVSLGILVCFFSFMAGYFIGQRKALERVAHTVEQDSLADQISSSLYSLYDTKVNGEEADDVDVSGELALEMTSTNTGALSEEHVAGESAVVEPSERYYAQLVGFGTAKAANAFARRLQNKSMPVKVNTRRSKSAKGKIISWYQVVTHPFDTKDELETLVEKISKEERIKGVNIVTC